MSSTSESRARPDSRRAPAYVSAGVSTPRLVVSHADGARVTDVDGRSSSTSPAGSAARTRATASRLSSTRSRRRPTTTCTSASWSGSYEPYVEVCRRLAELSPCRGSASRSRSSLNSGAEAIENAVKIARAATGRPAVIVFDNAFHGRTLLTMTMTAKVKPYKAGFGPFAPEVYRAPVPYPYRGITTRRRDRRLKHSSRPTPTRRPSPASCSSRSRARAASSRCRPTSRRA